jgi:hypothetical protein
LASPRSASLSSSESRGGSFRLEFRGLSGARSNVDPDMRLRIVLAARLWRLLGDNLTDEEKASSAQ